MSLIPCTQSQRIIVVKRFNKICQLLDLFLQCPNIVGNPPNYSNLYPGYRASINPLVPAFELFTPLNLKISWKNWSESNIINAIVPLNIKALYWIVP